MAGDKNKNRKYGRNKDACKRYYFDERRDQNKALRMLKHLAKRGFSVGIAQTVDIGHPDNTARLRFNALSHRARTYAMRVFGGLDKPRGQGRAVAGLKDVIYKFRLVVDY